MLSRLKREGKLLAVSLTAGMVFAFCVAAYTYVYSATAQRDIAENVIRFHVMANSDSAVDQDLKEYVRTEVLDKFSETLSSNGSIEEARLTFLHQVPELQTFVEELIRSEGYDYSVSVDLTTAYFPTQYYGDISFPPGNYEAVQITIGEGVGQNWWCLMFPPLCYVDMTASEESRTRLAETVSEESFLLLTHQEQSSPELEVRFRVVEWWQNRNAPTPQPTLPPAHQVVER
ncbi:MAG: stage II sporulation protein R [Clostridiales bacterium]|jgi:stage II sporulation protein R|nr:stage II sporulation protein R [Clostridiales bacterium]